MKGFSRKFLMFLYCMLAYVTLTVFSVLVIISGNIKIEKYYPQIVQYGLITAVALGVVIFLISKFKIVKKSGSRRSSDKPKV